MATFSYSLEELCARHTQASHQTIQHLEKIGLISPEQSAELQSKIIITFLRKDPSFGERILNKFFNIDDSIDNYVFVVSTIND